jgi:hypothetical protein
LPGDTPEEAFESYALPLKQVLGCVTSAHIRRPPGRQFGNESSPSLFAFTENPARLNGSRDLCLYFSQWFYVGPFDEKRFKVYTTSYRYHVINAADTYHELISFHWEPGRSATDNPHIHIGFSARDCDPPFSPKAHIPSGRVPIEDVVLFLIEELKVEPITHEWQAIILKARSAFMR